MATARVGGTSGKLSGQVGEKIYQIRKNADGTFTQIIYEKGVRTESVTSARLQAQRMVTAMVESMMKWLKPIAQISMQSGTTKTKSLNAFSSANLLLVAQDCKANWYHSDTFVYPVRARDAAKADDLGGEFIISSGTGSINHFSQMFHSVTPSWIIPDWSWRDSNFVGLQIDIPSGCVTIGDFLQKKKITRLDKIVFVYFHFWYEGNDETGLGEYKDRHDYVIASINSTISDSTPLTWQALNALFVLQKTSDKALLYRSDNANTIYLGVREDMLIDESVYYAAAFTISYATGKKLITDSRYQNMSRTPGVWLNGQSPADVFFSWMDEPRGSIYPSPFQ